MRQPALALAVVCIALASCGRYSKLTPAADETQMAAQPHVYGDAKGEALQHKNTYPANPDAAAEAAVLKVKLFADENVKAKPVDTAAALRSAQE